MPSRPPAERRWDVDERGHGLGDARPFLPGIRELADAMHEEQWVAEDADAHLLPHLRRACEALGFELLDTVTTQDAAFELRLRWSGATAGISHIREAVFALVGSIAESATYVRQHGHVGGDLVFEVVTGMLSRDTEFRSHGHTLRIHVSDAPPNLR